MLLNLLLTKLYEVSKWNSIHLLVTTNIYRYCLFYGLPLFSLGLFLREYGERIAENFNIGRIKSLLLIALGIALSLLQWFGLGKQEMPLGMVLVEIGIAMLVMIKPGSQFLGSTSCFLMEKSSLIIYIIHPLVDSIVDKYKNHVGLFSKMHSMESVYPLFVIAISLAIGMLYAVIALLMKKMRNH